MTKAKSVTPKTNKPAAKANSKHLYHRYIFPVYLALYICGIIYIVFSIFIISNDDSGKTNDSNTTVQSNLNSQANKSILDFIESAKSPDEAVKDPPFTSQDRTKLKDTNGRINPLNAKDDY